jgi:hypothetical protein
VGAADGTTPVSDATAAAPPLPPPTPAEPAAALHLRAALSAPVPLAPTATPRSLLPAVNPHFVGRVHEIGDVCAALAAAPPPPPPRPGGAGGAAAAAAPAASVVQALLCVGPRGGGKSALVLEYLHLYEEEAAYSFVWWADASSVPALAASLRSIAERAGLRDAGQCRRRGATVAADASAAPSPPAGYDFAGLCAAYVRALLCDHGGWCLVLDGLSDECAEALVAEGGVLAPAGAADGGGLPLRGEEGGEVPERRRQRLLSAGHVLVTARETERGVAASEARWRTVLRGCCGDGGGDGGGGGGSSFTVRRVDVGALSVSDAQELMLQHSADYDDHAAAAAVAEMLDRHPAALVEAAALVRAGGIFASLSAYQLAMAEELQAETETETEG